MELIPIYETIPADARMVELTSDAEAKTQVWLDHTVGTVHGDLSIASVAECRMADHPLIVGSREG